jgi:hypothetical protein
MNELLNKLIAIYNSKGYYDTEVVDNWLIIRHAVGVKGAESWVRQEGFASILANKDWIMKL